MRVLFTSSGWADYLAWQEHDRDTLRRVNELIRDIGRQPFRGIGKPEPLRGDLQGWWSRRITGDHRLVYRVAGVGEEQRIEIVACRYHCSRRG
ncbi:MAG TPA: Txe/YoeB family addiction module toxin [Stellaceae bacterium]|nr:Txe/YoeB family addiction module toxin [Stellaceae bacterium]